MRLGLFGGSFDPVHNGHLALADACQRAAELDEVWFVPTAVQPLKPGGPVASDADRAEMLRLATQVRPDWVVSTIEVDRGGVSYTVDTLRTLAAAGPQAELFFLMGADAFRDLPGWREPDAILRLAKPVVVARAGEAFPDSAIEHARVEMPACAVSSTELRRRLATGGSCDGLAPVPVLEYAINAGVYTHE